MIKFKIERGVNPPKRGPKPKLDYQALINMLPNMEPGDSIKVTEVARTARNSTYLTVKGALGQAFLDLGGGFRVSTTLKDEDNCEVRVWKDAGEPKKKHRK